MASTTPASLFNLAIFILSSFFFSDSRNLASNVQRERERTMHSPESHCKPRLEKLTWAFCSASTIPDTASGIPRDFNQFSPRQDFGSKLKLSEKTLTSWKKKERNHCCGDKSWKRTSPKCLCWNNAKFACCTAIQCRKPNVFYRETSDVYHIVSLSLVPKRFGGEYRH